MSDLIHVPGCYVCDKCGFIQTFSLLSANTGAVGTDDTVRDLACPNDGELMRLQTWKERCYAVVANCERQIERAVAAENRVKALEAKLDAMTPQSDWTRVQNQLCSYCKKPILSQPFELLGPHPKAGFYHLSCSEIALKEL